MKKKLFKKIFKKEIDIYEEKINAYEREIDWLKDIIRIANDDEVEHAKMLQLYEEELTRLEKQNEILTLIIGSLKLYERGNIWIEILLWSQL